MVCASFFTFFVGEIRVLFVPLCTLRLAGFLKKLFNVIVAEAVACLGNSSCTMRESFLHFLWQTLRFEVRGLATTAGAPVEVLRRGMLNGHQGADFQGAEVRIGGTLWHGAVEMHVQSGEWYAHGHQNDVAYNNVVLHVVWQAGSRPILRQDGTEVPELVLEGRVAADVLARYAALEHAQTALPCASMLPTVPTVVCQAWVERLGVERMQARAEALQPRLRTADWQQVLWEEIAAYMGGNPNREAFRAIAAQLPFRTLTHHAGSALQVEALLLGVAGLLSDVPAAEDYAQRLRAEWDFLQQKYQLQPAAIALKWAKMYPAAFPTIRLSQLANVVQAFPVLIRLLEPDGFARWLRTEISTGTYWQQHIKWAQPMARLPRVLGATAKHQVLSNALIPLAVLYAAAHGSDDTAELVESGLALLPPENNAITRKYVELSFPNRNAMQSLGLIRLQNEYCAPRKCLNCAVGQHLVGNANTAFKG